MTTTPATNAARPSPRSPCRARALTVLYDAHCPICRQARRWVERQRPIITIRFVPAGSDEARRRFPQLAVASTLAGVTAITDEGAVLRGERAWIAVLWGIARTRRLAIELAHGRGSWRLRRVRSAAELVRRWSASEPALRRRTGAPRSAPQAGPTASPGSDRHR